MSENLPEKKSKDLLPITPDLIQGVDLNSEEQQVVLNHLEKVRYHPVCNLVLECKHRGCEYQSSCILVKMNKLPEFGAGCPIEMAQITIWTEQLINEMKVDPDNIIDQAQVREIVALYVFEDRAYRGYLSKDPMVVETVKNIAFDGTRITEQTLHPLFRQLDISQKTRRRVMESLLATREAKAKVDIAATDNTMAALADIMDKVNAKTIDAKVKDG